MKITIDTFTGPGLLLPPGGAPGLIGAAPHNLLLGAALGPPQAGAPLLTGPPPALAGFDASQPPPGLRLPGLIPPPKLPIVNNGGNNDDNDNMELEQEGEHGPPQPPQGRKERTRGSRWNREEPQADAPPAVGENLANRLRNLAGHGEDSGPRRSDGPWTNGGGPNGGFDEHRLGKSHFLSPKSRFGVSTCDTVRV